MQCLLSLRNKMQQFMCKSFDVPSAFVAKDHFYRYIYA